MREHVEKFVFYEFCRDGRDLCVVDRSGPGPHQTHTDVLSAVYQCAACDSRGSLFIDTNTGEEWCEGGICHVDNL